MPETRRPSTRLKGERQSKRKQVTPPSNPQPRSKRRTPTPDPVDEVEILPSTISDERPLPVIGEPQNIDVLEPGFQSISKSGVLKASLEKSRQSWLADGLFEKYWSKVTKKNPQDASNPDKNSMQRLGPCTLIIEPHHFDIITHSVKSSQQVTFLPPQKPLYAQPGATSYGSPYGHSFPHSEPSPVPQPVLTTPGHFGGQQQVGLSTTTRPHQMQNTNTIHNPTQPPVVPPATSITPQPLNTAPAQKHDSLNLSTPHSTAGVAGGIPGAGTTDKQAPTQSAPKRNEQAPQQSPHPSQPAVKPGPSNPPAPNQENTGTDPVIQMLAARAAEDPNLKALMKVVAQGHANQEQLGIFQRHIDELNAIINERKKQAASEIAATTQQASPTPASSPAPRPSIPAPVMTPPPPPRPIHPASIPQVKKEPLMPHYSQSFHQPQPLKAKPTQVKKEISAIVFEFVGMPHTRYLLPKNSIVEKISDRNPTEYVLSFLVTRKAGPELGSKYKEGKEYYQVVTIRLQSNNEKFLEGVPRAVADPEEVRRHMAEIMETTDMAETVYLATRLPLDEGEDPTKVKDSRPTEVSTDPDAPQSHYEAPNSILPLRNVTYRSRASIT